MIIWIYLFSITSSLTDSSQNLNKYKQFPEASNNRRVIHKPVSTAVRHRGTDKESSRIQKYPHKQRWEEGSSADRGGKVEEKLSRNLFKRKLTDDEASFTAITGIKIGDKSECPKLQPHAYPSTSQTKFKKYLDLSLENVSMLLNDEEMMDWEPVPNEVALEEVHKNCSSLFVLFRSLLDITLLNS